MDWPVQMNKALDYIEKNLTKEIDIKKIAELACCSEYNFQRLFSFITGLSLAYYIRKRIMTKATEDLLTEKESVLSVSLKYGYDSPSSFARAYKQVTGISPNQALKEGTELVSFTPLSFQIMMKGSNDMKFRIEKEDGFVVSGISQRFTNKNGENFKAIPQMWADLMDNGKLEKICKIKTKMDGLFGVCYDFSDNCTLFKYMIGVNGTEKGYEKIEIKPQTYAKFSCVGVDDLQNTTKKIFADWLPNSNYQHADSPELEFYPPHDVNDDQWPCEIWIPVVEKR